MVLMKNLDVWVFIVQRFKRQKYYYISLSIQDCKVSMPNIFSMAAKD